MIINPKRIFLTLGLSGFLLLAWGQSNSCITFEDLETGATFGREDHEPGSIAFSEAGLAVQLEPFQYFDGSTDFISATVMEDIFVDFEEADGKYLFVSNINLFFDFTTLERPIRKLCIAFFDGGGEENIAVNGQDIKVLNHFGEAPTEIAPGVTLSVTPPVGENQFISSGLLCLEGNIETLLLGGQEFAIDNICYEDCAIYDLSAEVIDCQQHPNQYYQYDIKLDFEYETSEQIGFDLYQGDTFIGFHEYSELPLTLNEVSNAQDQGAFAFTVCENDSENCCRTIIVPLAPCESQCEIRATVLGVDCNVSETEYIASIKVEGDNIGQKYVATNLVGEQHIFEYTPGAIDLVFSATQQGYDEILICDYDSPECCYNLALEHPCFPASTCEIGSISAELLNCQFTGTGLVYDVKIDFDYAGTTNEYFDLFDRNGLIESYRFTDLPLSLTGLEAEGNPDNLYFKVAENDNLDCFSVTEILTTDCQGQENCNIDNVRVWEMGCNEAGTEFLALISVEGVGLGQKFSATNLAGERFYYEYPAAGSEVTIGFSTREEGFDQIEICDYESEGCCYTLDVEYPCTPNTNCEIGDLNVEVLDCEPSASGAIYNLKIDFAYTGTTNDYFDLFGRDGLIGFYRFDQLPLTLNDIEINGNADYLYFKVAENDNLDCRAEVEIPRPNCEASGECTISNVNVTARTCEEGLYLLDLTFDKAGPGPLGYYAYGDGAIFGPFSYEEESVSIGPFPGDGETIVDILVLDIANPACFGYIEYGPLDCATQCSITNVFAEAHPCEDGKFFVDIEFDSQNPGSQGFTVRGNGRDYGSFEYGAPFVTVGPIEGDPEQELEFVIIDNIDPNCQNFTTLAPIDCPSCEINDLSYTIDCHEEGLNFTLNLDFNISDPSSDRFHVKFDGDVYEGFSYNTLPLSLELPLEMADISSISICDTEATDCCQTIDISIPCCSVRDLVVEPHPCAEDGSFLVDLDLFHTNTSDSFTLVYGPQGGQLANSTFSYEDLHLTLGPLDGSTSSEWYFQVTDESLFCSTSQTLSVEACEDDACTDFEDSTLGSYGPVTGYNQGDVFAEEDGIKFRIDSDCNCFIHLVEYPSAVPQFTAAMGNMLILDEAGLGIDFTQLPAPTATLTLDYYYQASSIGLAINGGEVITADRPDNLPINIAPGVILDVVVDEVDERMGRFVFTGSITDLSVQVEGKLLLDNLCQTPGSEEVWPGDINVDNIANHYDLLPLGIALGAEGPIRENESTAWEGLPAADWEQSFPSGINYKHADTDGSGRIELADQDAILDNFLLTHGEVNPFEPIPATPNNPRLYVEAPADGWPVGQAFNLPIVLGTAAVPVEDLYGLAFTLRFDPDVLVPESIAISTENSLLSSDGEDVISIDKTYAEDGIIYLAISRVSQQNILGSGPVASLIGIIDDIAGLQSTTFSVEAPLAVTADLDTIPIFADTTNLNIQRFRDVPNLDLLRSVVLSPNPTQDVIRISNKYGIPVDKVDVMDSAGNLIATNIKHQNTISLSSHPAGVYMLRIKIGELIIHRRVVRL